MVFVDGFFSAFGPLSCFCCFLQLRFSSKPSGCVVMDIFMQKELLYGQTLRQSGSSKQANWTGP